MGRKRERVMRMRGSRELTHLAHGICESTLSIFSCSRMASANAFIYIIQWPSHPIMNAKEESMSSNRAR